MTLMPGAVWRPISINYTKRRRASTNALILHVDAMNSDSLYAWFMNPAARASSHLHVKKSGVIEQYIDLDLISWASKDGDARAITVETQGRDGEPWTQAQLDSLVRIAQFVNRKYGIPLQMMRDSRTATSGIGWHRLGIEGNFGNDPLTGLCRVAGGESWSGARGKTCPGNDRIKQVPNIIARAKGESEEDDVALTPSEKRALAWLDDNRGELDVLQFQVKDVWTYREKWNQTLGEVAGLKVALAAVAAGEDIDMEAVTEAAREGARAGLSDALGSVTADVKVTVENA